MQIELFNIPKYISMYDYKDKKKYILGDLEQSLASISELQFDKVMSLDESIKATIYECKKFIKAQQERYHEN